MIQDLITADTKGKLITCHVKHGITNLNWYMYLNSLRYFRIMWTRPPETKYLLKSEPTTTGN